MSVGHRSLFLSKMKERKSSFFHETKLTYPSVSPPPVLAVSPWTPLLSESSQRCLLDVLTSPASTPTQHLEQKQALARQFAHILHFTLRFDELKVRSCTSCSSCCSCTSCCSCSSCSSCTALHPPSFFSSTPPLLYLFSCFHLPLLISAASLILMSFIFAAPSFFSSGGM